jgi:hypothetical protein
MCPYLDLREHLVHAISCAANRLHSLQHTIGDIIQGLMTLIRYHIIMRRFWYEPVPLLRVQLNKK